MTNYNHFQQFSALFIVGMGLFLVGCGNALVGAGSRWRTLTVLSIASLVCVGIASLLIEQLVPWFAGAGFACLGLGIVSSLKSVRSLVASASVRWVFVAVVGLSIILCSCWRYDAQSRAINNEANQLLDMQSSHPPSAEDSTIHATTDRGTPLHLMKFLDERNPADSVEAERHYLATLLQKETIIRRQPATDASNCHGWVFASGRYSLPKDDVERILTENNYTITTQSQVHDLVIYRDADQHISHTAIICAVLDDGAILVEGKWGRLGVYIHDVRGSCYGDNFHYYHSPRVGHLVHGLSPLPQSTLTSPNHEPDSKH